MFKIYYSIDGVLERLTRNKSRENTTCGWGRLISTMRNLLVNNGFELVGNPQEADLELFVGQPLLYLYPQVHPAIILTMYESTLLPKLWVDSINKWDLVINPSAWGKNTFIASGVNVPIEIIPLPVNADKFRYIDRDINSDWVYLTQGVQLKDRKNVTMVADVFESGMPDDSYLIVKTLPRADQPNFNLWVHNQLLLIQEAFEFNQYLDEILSISHVSVNPSSSEGFGYLSAESMATGMCTIISDYSAFKDQLVSGYCLPIKTFEALSNIAVYGGNIGYPDFDDLKKQMLWTYENREKSIELGRLSRQFVIDNYSPSIIADRLVIEFEQVVKHIPKSLNLLTDDDDDRVAHSYL